jgi:hypothetical protein
MAVRVIGFQRDHIAVGVFEKVDFSIHGRLAEIRG